jgi:predicted transcriptional regulator of viral defense system
MNNYKTHGKVSAYLIDRLYGENRLVFTISDTQKILSMDYNRTTDLLSKLVKRKIISRLKSGKFIIVPQEAGNTEKYIGNWFIAASEIINSPDYYIGFYSAMNYWGMLTQPLYRTFIVSPKRQVVPEGLKDFMNLIFIKEKYIWGIGEQWITRTRKVRISDQEKTILDGFLYPQHCGGITELAKGIWIVKDKIDYNKLNEYVVKYNKNVIAKRLGYILETLGIKKQPLLSDLRLFVRDRYDLLDPSMPYDKIDKNSWHLTDNIGKKQILNLINY